jgi:hypothetical protein
MKLYEKGFEKMHIPIGFSSTASNGMWIRFLFESLVNIQALAPVHITQRLQEFGISQMV